MSHPVVLITDNVQHCHTSKGEITLVNSGLKFYFTFAKKKKKNLNSG